MNDSDLLTPVAARCSRVSAWAGWSIFRAMAQSARNQRYLLWFAGAMVAIPLIAFAWGAAVAPGTGRVLLVQPMLVSVGGALMLVTWLLVVQSLLQQNRATHARLVPGHLRALRQVMFAIWFALSLVTLGTIAWVRSAWFQLDPIADFAIVAGTTAFMAAALRWPLLWVVYWMWPLFAPRLTDSLVSREASFGAWWPVFPLAIASLLGLALTRLLQSGGERHRRGDANRLRMNTQRGMYARQAGGWGGSAALGRWMSAPYYLCFGVLVGRRDSSLWPRLMLAFGPGLHGAVQAAWGLGLLALGLGGLALASVRGWIPASGLSGPQVWGPVVGLLSAAINPVIGAAAGLYRTRREQALLALLPGVPRGAALNRALATRLLLRFGVAWAVSLGALLVLGRFAPSLAPALLAAAIGMAPTALWMCSDVSRMAPPAADPRFAVKLLVLIAGPLAGLVLNRVVGMAVAEVAVAVLLPTAVLLAWRWRALAYLPGAFPAGRF